MAKSPESVQDAVMDVGRMKAVLKLALTGDDDGKVRLPIVIGLDNDDEGVVSVAKRGNPKMLRTELIKTIQKEGLTARMKPDPAKLYFGYAYTNDDAEGVLQIDVNKQPAGADKLANRIFRKVRTAGFSAVVFHVNEELDAAAEGGAAEGGAAEGGAAAEGVPAAGEQGGAAAAAPAVADMAALARELAAAIGGIMRAAGADPGRKASLVQLAGSANAAVKAGDAGEAARLIAALKAAIEAGAQGGAAAAGGTEARGPEKPPPRVAPDKLLELFRDAKEEVDDGLNKLQAALRETGDDDLLRIAEFGLYGMTEGTGVGLMKALLELQAARPAPGDPLIAAASEAARAYQAAVFADAAVDLVDDNPFGVTVGIRAKLGPALDTIARAA